MGHTFASSKWGTTWIYKELITFVLFPKVFKVVGVVLVSFKILWNSSIERFS